MGGKYFVSAFKFSSPQKLLRVYFVVTQPFLSVPVISPPVSLYLLFLPSTAEEKGSDCIDKFRAMQECFQKYPDLYKDYEEDSEETTKTEEEGKGEKMGAEGEEKGSEQSSGGDGGSRVLTSSSVPGS